MLGARDEDLREVAAAFHSYGSSMNIVIDATTHKEQSNYQLNQFYVEQRAHLNQAAVGVDPAIALQLQQHALAAELPGNRQTRPWLKPAKLEPKPSS